MGYDSTQEDRLWAMLSYVLLFVASFIAPLVIFLVKKDNSKFVAYHALQSLLLVGGLVVLTIAVNIIGAILTAIHLWLLAVPLFLVLGLVGLGAFVLVIIAAIKSYGGEWYEMPVVGKIARQQVGV